MARLRHAAIVLALCHTWGTAGAQMEPRFGVQLGGNLSRVSVSSVEIDVEEQGRVGFQGGIVARIGDGRIAFMPGAIVTQKAADGFIDEDGFSPYKVEQRMTYLQFPLLALFRPRAEDYPGELAPFFFAGPAVAHQVSCSIRVFSDDVEQFDCTKLSTTISTTKTVASLIVGGGVEVGEVSVAIQYDYGLTNLHAESRFSVVKDRTISLVARYFFGRR